MFWEFGCKIRFLIWLADLLYVLLPSCKISGLTIRNSSQILKKLVMGLLQELLGEVLQSASYSQ